MGQGFGVQRAVEDCPTQRLTYEVVFGVTSLTADQVSPHRLLQMVRHHWHIENRLHYVRDVTFHEDACPFAIPNANDVLPVLIIWSLASFVSVISSTSRQPDVTLPSTTIRPFSSYFNDFAQALARAPSWSCIPSCLVYKRPFGKSK